MPIRDLRGLNITRDENRTVEAGVGTAVANALGQTTISLDLADLSAESSMDETADYVPIYSNADAAHRKVLAENIPEATLTVTGTIVNVYTTPGSDTWVKPAGATMVYVCCIGGGGGGGGGGYSSTSTGVYGGSGGAGGAVTYAMLPAEFLPSSVDITVGAAGVAGTGGGFGGTGTNSGTVGTAGGESKFGTFLRASGGDGGFGGTTTSISEGQTPPSASTGMFSGGAGGDADDDQDSGAGGSSTRHGGGGGGGGGSYSGTTSRVPGAGGAAWAHTPIGYTQPAAGVNSSTVNGTNGADALQYCPDDSPTGGSGGGGGGAARTTAGLQAGRGGHGAKYGGAGGGGGAVNNVGASGRGGNGGNGAQGAVMVITFL